MNIFEKIECLTDQPSYRFKQLNQAIFVDLIDDWEQATSLPVSLRTALKEELPIKIEAEQVDSDDKNTFKAVIKLIDNVYIETVLMHHKTGRNTICISTQAGCPLACSFCATGCLGFKRNLTVWEILFQVLYWERFLKKKQARVENVVFMGMGEPFLNFKNFLEAVYVLNDEAGLNIGARHISVSTAGIIPGIRALTKENIQINLAISLHAPDNELRTSLMPINKKYKIEDLLSAVEEYTAKTNRQVMFEYLLIDGVNDSPAQAKRLAKLLQSNKLYYVNLLRYHETGTYQPSTKERADAFYEILKTAGVKCGFRHSFGIDIEAACGQLAAKLANK